MTMATTKDFALSFVLFSFSEPKSERDDDIHVHVVTMLRQMREKDECDLLTVKLWSLEYNCGTTEVKQKSAMVALLA